MKKIKLFTMALAALTIVSCSKENEGGIERNDVIKELRVSIAGTGSTTRAEEVGNGAENTILEYAAFAKIKAAGTYECKVTTTPTAPLSFTGVSAGSTIYVIANATKSGDEKDPYTAGKTDYTEDEVKALAVTVTKVQLNNFTTSLQDHITIPGSDITFANGAAIVMTGSTPVAGAPDADGKVNVEVALSREFARVDAEATSLVYETTFGIEATPLAKLEGATKYIVRRVASQVAGFSNTAFITSAFKDEQPNGVEPTDPTGGYRYEYATGLGTATTTPQVKNFYVTSNFATAKVGSTVLVYEVKFTALQEIPANTMSGQTAAISQGTEFSRYYKAYITDNSETAYNTEKSVLYQFSNTLKSWGSETEEIAINNEVVDLKVTVTIKKWLTKSITVDMG